MTIEELKLQAQERIDTLQAVLDMAVEKGFDPSYYAIPAIVGQIALEERWRLEGHDALKKDYVDWIVQNCSTAEAELREVLKGTSIGLEPPPMPRAADLELENGYLRLNGEPVLLLGFMGNTIPEVRGRYTFQENVMAFVSGMGGTRFDYTTSPVWPLYKEDPPTHRVWAGGWCGHIICDRHSIGGVEEGECIICLENERMRGAIAQYIERETVQRRERPETRFYSLDWELAYICFCDQTLEMWRNWLRDLHQDVQTLNVVWGTTFAGFDSVSLPEMDVKAETNRAKWYDFARFNCWRFTDYLIWSRNQIRRHAPGALTCTGAPFYMMSAQMGWAGIDTELINDAMDVVLNEAHPSTLPTDVLTGMNRKGSLLQDPEYHGDIAHVMAHFLHGDGFMQMWWWPETSDYIEAGRPPSFYRSDVMRSPSVPLGDLALVLRNALDLRRLSREIVQFHQRTPEQKAPLAVLYSHTSMLQLPPELRQGRNTPYVFALRTVYDGLLYLDASTRITTERQIGDGELGTVKTLVLPGVEYQDAHTVDTILNWVTGGGTLVLTPNSWLADEYARPADYLDRIGIELEGMDLPGITVSEARPDIEREGGFIMGAVSEVELKDVPRASLKIASTGPFEGRSLSLEGWGVRQHLRCTAEGSEVLAAFGDGSPAIVRTPFGAGEIYYLGIPLTDESFAAFMDPILDTAGFPRPVRVTDPIGGRPHRIESRTIQTEGGYLTYVINLNPEPADVHLAIPENVSQIENLSSQRECGRDLTLGRFETVLLKLHLK